MGPSSPSTVVLGWVSFHDWISLLSQMADRNVVSKPAAIKEGAISEGSFSCNKQTRSHGSPGIRTKLRAEINLRCWVRGCGAGL